MPGRQIRMRRRHAGEVEVSLVNLWGGSVDMQDSGTTHRFAEVPAYLEAYQGTCLDPFGRRIATFSNQGITQVYLGDPLDFLIDSVDGVSTPDPVLV